MSAPTFLNVDEVIEIHEDQIARFGGSPGVRDRTLMESAVHVPAASFAGQYLHNDIFEMAAAYLFHLVKNHAFRREQTDRRRYRRHFPPTERVGRGERRACIQ